MDSYFYQEPVFLGSDNETKVDHASTKLEKADDNVTSSSSAWIDTQFESADAYLARISSKHHGFERPPAMVKNPWLQDSQ
jgi:hypothetical protein